MSILYGHSKWSSEFILKNSIRGNYTYSGYIYYLKSYGYLSNAISSEEYAQLLLEQLVIGESE